VLHHHAVGDARTWRLFAAVEGYDEAARVGLQLLPGIEADANAYGDEGTKGAVNAGAELDPLFSGFRPESR